MLKETKIKSVTFRNMTVNVKFSTYVLSSIYVLATEIVPVGDAGAEAV